MYWTESTEGVANVRGRPLRKLWLSAGIGITPFVAHMRTYLRFYSMHDQVRIKVPRSDILWLHMDQTSEHVPCLKEIASLVRTSSALDDVPMVVHCVLCLSRYCEQEQGRGDRVRAAAVFGSDVVGIVGPHAVRQLEKLRHPLYVWL
jgi:ferredoxin-NADP reductase